MKLKANFLTRGLVMAIGIPVIAVVLTYHALGAALYTKELAAFYGLEWEPWKHGVSENGKPGNIGPTVPIEYLKVHSEEGNASIAQMCPGMASTRGAITISEVNGAQVCCNAFSGQDVVAIREVAGQIHYLCGKWPNTDYVVQVKNTVKSK